MTTIPQQRPSTVVDALDAPAHGGRHPLDVADLRARVDDELRAFLERQARVLDGVGAGLAPVSAALHDFVVDGGKRLRPGFCYWGWRAAGGLPGTACENGVVRAAAALELLQAGALIHDDLMDGSDTRRGRPSMHRRFEALHRGAGWQGSDEAFGGAASVLLGDLCLAWSDEMLGTSGVGADALAAAKPLFDLMRTEVMAGQYLDILEQAAGGGSVERSRRVMRFKSAKYTIERPLHVGAALAGASQDVTDALSAYGLPLGEAFQLRDDVLGVFGDPAVTGKPAGDDLRSGKRTVLLAVAGERARGADAALLRALPGDPGLGDDGVAALREAIEASGALADVEAMIAGLTDQALAALDAAPLAPEACDVLRALAGAATVRSH